MKMTVGQLKHEIEYLPDEIPIYLAVYQHYTPPEDRVTGVAEVEVDGETRIYLEGQQTGDYVPGEVRKWFGW